jgi:hypothetical protein
MSLSAYSQSVFTYDLKKDLVIGAAALGIFACPFLADNAPANVPAELDKEDINTLDRSLYGWTIPLVHKRMNKQDHVAVDITGDSFIVAIKL